MMHQKVFEGKNISIAITLGEFNDRVALSSVRLEKYMNNEIREPEAIILDSFHKVAKDFSEMWDTLINGMNITERRYLLKKKHRLIEIHREAWDLREQFNLMKGFHNLDCDVISDFLADYRLAFSLNEERNRIIHEIDDIFDQDKSDHKIYTTTGSE